MLAVAAMLLLASQQPREGAIWNVKNYGVVGDGITDDTTAIRTIIQWAEDNGGGRIYFPCGEYVIDYQGWSVGSGTGENTLGDPILNLPSNTEVFGDGPCSVITLPYDYDDTHNEHPEDYCSAGDVATNTHGCAALGLGAAIIDDSHRLIGATVKNTDTTPTRENYSIHDIAIGGGFEPEDTCRGNAEQSFNTYFVAAATKITQKSLDGIGVGDYWDSTGAGGAESPAFTGGSSFGSGRRAVVRIFDTCNEGDLQVEFRLTFVDMLGATVTEDTGVMDQDDGRYGRIFHTASYVSSLTKVEILSIAGYENAAANAACGDATDDRFTVALKDPIQNIVLDNVLSQNSENPIYFNQGTSNIRVVNSFVKNYCRGGITVNGNWHLPTRNVEIVGNSFQRHPSSNGGRAIDIESGNGPMVGILMIGNNVDTDIEAGRCDDCVIQGNNIHGTIPNSDNENLLIKGNVIRSEDPTEGYVIGFNGDCIDCVVEGNTIILNLPAGYTGDRNAINFLRAATGSPTRVSIVGNIIEAQSTTGHEASAIKIDRGYNVTISGNIVTGAWNNGVYLDDTDQATVTGNQVEGSAQGIHLANVYGVNYKLTASGNAFYSTSKNKFDGCTDCAISGNSFTGYVLLKNMTRGTFTGNTVVSTDPDAADSAALSLVPPSTGVEIVGNTVELVLTGATTTDMNGIYLKYADPDVVKHSIIADNTVITNSTDGNEEEGISIRRAEWIKVSGNHVQGRWDDGIFCNGCRDVNFSDNDVDDADENGLFIDDAAQPSQRIFARGNNLDGATADLRYDGATCATDAVDIWIEDNFLVNGLRTFTGTCPANGEVNVSIADNGLGTPANWNTTPTANQRVFLFDCLDTHGCTVSPGEAGGAGAGDDAKRGDRILLVNVSAAARVVTVTDVAGIDVTPGGAGVALAQSEWAECVYRDDGSTALWMCR